MYRNYHRKCRVTLNSGNGHCLLKVLITALLLLFAILYKPLVHLLKERFIKITIAVETASSQYIPNPARQPSAALHQTVAAVVSPPHIRAPMQDYPGTKKSYSGHYLSHYTRWIAIRTINHPTGNKHINTCTHCHKCVCP